jgi:hypothetical protein
MVYGFFRGFLASRFVFLDCFLSNYFSDLSFLLLFFWAAIAESRRGLQRLFRNSFCEALDSHQTHEMTRKK